MVLEDKMEIEAEYWDGIGRNYSIAKWIFIIGLIGILILFFFIILNKP